MPKFKDLTNQRFGKLVVIKDTGLKNRDHRHIWLCKCDCGQIVEVSSHCLGTHTKSCGCLRIETTRELNKSHGLSNSKLFYVWNLMKKRCLNPKNKDYKYYGGRGITIYKEWVDSFLNFYEWATNNGYSDGLTIDRINNDGNYEPDNCRWVSRKIQSNNRRSNHLVTYRGKTQSLQLWCEELGISRFALSDRLNKLNWDVEKAFNTSLKKRGK